MSSQEPGGDVPPQGRDGRQPAASRREAHPLARVGAVALVVVLAVAKVTALNSLSHDGRTYLFVIFGLSAVLTLYRARPLSTAAAVSVIVALAVDPHPFGRGVLLGVIAFLILSLGSILASWGVGRLSRVDELSGSGWLS